MLPIKNPTAAVLVIICICCNLNGITQSLIDYRHYNISRLTPDDGLSQGSNYFRFEDSKGFMWLTANDAINRYDGSTVKLYDLDKYFLNCPNLQQGYGFAEDDKSNIYIGSVNGLYIYHRNKDKFTLKKIFAQSAGQETMPFAFKNGRVWCFNKEYEIATYDVATDRTNFYKGVNLPAIHSIHIYDLEASILYYRWPFFDKENNIWFTGINKLVCYNPVTKTCTNPMAEYINKNGVKFFCSVYNKENNSIYLGTSDGFLIYEIRNAHLKKIKKILNNKIGWVTNIAINKNFIALREKYNLIFSDTGFAGYLNVSLNKPFYFRTNSYGFDNSGRLWMCDDGLGQIVFDFTHKLFFKEPNENSHVNYFHETGVSNFAQFPNGDIFLRNDIIQDNRTKELKYFPLKAIGKENVYFRSSSDFFRKGVWLFSEGDLNNLRIYFLNQEKKLIPFFSGSTGEPNGQMQDLQVLLDGRILCSTSTGLYWLNTRLKKMEKIYNEIQLNAFKINQLSNNRVAISYLNNNMLLSQIKPDNNIIFLQKILPGIQSFYIAEDSVKKQYWVGSNQGMYLLNDSFGIIKKFDANTGLAGTYIYGVLLDDVGNVWCSHQRGLSSINTSSYQIINYTKEDGIQDWDFNNRAYYKAIDGTLYFGGVKGFNYFRPPLIKSSYYKTEIYIDEIIVNNQPYLPDTSANLIDDIHLSTNQNNLSFHAIAKNLASAGEQQILYRVNASEWTRLKNNSFINFSSLSPGKYKLELAVYDKVLNKVQTEKLINVTIAKPFYLAIWFWVLTSILLTTTVLWWRNRNKLAKQKRIFQQQLELEKQRLKIMADLHDDIGASLSSLQINSSVANHLIALHPQKAKVVLGKIEAQSKRLSENIGDIIWSMKPGKGEFMSLSSRIKTFAVDILSSTNINFALQIDKEADVAIANFTARKNTVLIIKEAINNAVKYSNATEININIGVTNGFAVIEVKDNGKGLDLKSQPGNGLENMKKRAQELNGIFEIKSQPELGTIIQCKIPV